MADREFPNININTASVINDDKTKKQLNKLCICTVELGLGEDAATEAEPILPVADVEGRHGRVVGHLDKRFNQTN